MASTEQALSDYVTLVSNDGFEFKIQRNAAIHSPAISRMLNPKNGFMESKTNTCVFDNINSSVLEKVCEYFYYYQKNIDARDVASLDIPAEMCLEVLMAADYLDM